ncbi:RING finger protein 145 [Siniperca chuatsi]|uniref:RING finger protein 145 n=1 Tax=Siniperca chuatsi TaxID=119488 RepID=UPI001CE0890D|nr:RING finger protein 145 [Siniperca chuatsi]
MPRLEELANVALRVPSILVLDLLYKCDIEGLTEHLKAKNEDMLFKYKYVIWNMYYLGHLINVVLLVLPLRHIVTLYLHILAALLLYMGHQISKDYVREELQYGYEGAVYLDSLAFNRFVSAMTSQIILSTLCAFLMSTRKVWLFSAHMLPLLARLCAAPHATLLTVNTFSMGLTGAGITVFLLSHLFLPYRLARAAYSELLQLEVIELYRLLAVGISLWNQFAVPVLFSVFWFVLFIVQLCSDTMSGSASAGHQGIMFFLLTSVSECCATPYSLLGLTFVVSYLALGLLNLCKFYLGGYVAVQNENVMHRGVTEGVTLLLLALQTGLLDMQALQRTFLLSIILFIVVTSTLQSMIEITDPVILALGASRNRSLWKHFRGLSMCLLLLIFPVYMAYKISQFFHMDFWLLILVSSCMLTSLQVTGTMLIYSLFMVELFRSDPIESLDEVIYWVNAVSRVLEFVVALCVVAYGTWESLFGEWSWMGASVIIIHSYFNVWLRAQSGWRSFLLRQEAAKKINSLPRATAQQLQQHNDVCSICFQEMSSAVITYCGHFFHGNCLRKWLYVQETCPMCHQTVRPTPPGQSQASGDAPAAPTQRDTGPDPAAQEGDQNQDNGTSQETQSDAVTPDPTKQQEETESFEDGHCGTEDKGQPAEPHREAVQGLRFSSSGDFVGFVSPVSSCSSGGISSSHVLLGKTSPPNKHNQVEESDKNFPLPLTPNAVNENTVEGQSDSKRAELEVTFCPRVPQNGDGRYDSCDGTPKTWNSLDSPESSNNPERNLEASGTSLVDSQTSVTSCNSELLDCIDNPQSHKGNSTF